MGKWLTSRLKSIQSGSLVICPTVHIANKPNPATPPASKRTDQESSSALPPISLRTDGISAGFCGTEGLTNNRQVASYYKLIIKVCDEGAPGSDLQRRNRPHIHSRARRLPWVPDKVLEFRRLGIIAKPQNAQWLMSLLTVGVFWLTPQVWWQR